MGSEIEQTRPASTTVRSWLDNDRTREMLRDALAGWMDPATFAAQCYLAARDPKLAGCSAESMFAAFLRCAEMGLLPSTHHRHVALIPRKVRDRNGRDTGEIAIDPMPQWQGFKALFEREPEVQQTRAVLVHTRDVFAIGVDGVPVQGNRDARCTDDEPVRGAIAQVIGHQHAGAGRPGPAGGSVCRSAVRSSGWSTRTTRKCPKVNAARSSCAARS